MILRRAGAYTGTLAGQPLGFQAVPAGIGTVELHWTTVPEDTAYAAFRVVRRQDRFPRDEYDGETVYEGPGSSCTDQGLPPGARCYYRGFARSKEGVYQNSYCQASAVVREKQPLILLPAGSVVRLQEKGEWQEYVVAHQGYPQRAGGGTLLLRRHIAGRRNMSALMQNEYEGSMADSWLSGVFLPTLDSQVAQSIPHSAIPCTKGGSGESKVLERQVFLLSAAELGGGEEGMGREGSPLDLCSTSGWQTALFQGAPFLWGTRSPDTRTQNQFWMVDETGAFAAKAVNETCGMRPALVLPGDRFAADQEGRLTAAEPSAGE